MTAAKYDISEALGVRQVGENEFESIHPPERIGAFTDRAFGGVTSAMSLNAAYLTVPDGLHIYSLHGNFLGPGLVDRLLHLSIRRIRDTKTFATRMIEASQLHDNGTRRICLVITADFMAQERKVALKYTEKPRRIWSRPKDGESTEQKTARYVKEGKISQKLADMTCKSIDFILNHYDMSYCTDSVFGDTLFGGASFLPTKDDHLSIVEKVSGDWVKTKAKLNTERDHAAALACLADMATGFIAAVHNKQGLADYGVTSSLEFSLRFFSNKLNLNEWHLREMAARVGSEGRSFHEIRLWDKNEQLIAIMTQQAMMRPKQEKKVKKANL